MGEGQYERGRGVGERVIKGFFIMILGACKNLFKKIVKKLLSDSSLVGMGSNGIVFSLLLMMIETLSKCI